MDILKRKTQKNIRTESETDIFLKKHVGLIHCENKLTLIQRKICNILLFVALDKIDEPIHELSLRQLCSLVGYNSNDIKLIKESIKSLISVVMEWNLLEDSKFLNMEDCPRMRLRGMRAPYWQAHPLKMASYAILIARK